MLPDRKMTHGEKYDPALKITNPDKADEYFEQCVQHCMKTIGVDREAAATIERANIIAYAGYCSEQTYKRALDLYFRVQLFPEKKFNKDEGFNINRKVWVKLTSEGLAHFERVHANALMVAQAHGRKAHSFAVGEWAEFQLWELMMDFGPGMHLGMGHTFFVNNEIFFSKPEPA